jgi:diguanylate cyclase (GGDEF)-like protein
MPSSMDGGSSYSDVGNIQEDLRQQVSEVILDRAGLLVWDTVAIFPFSGTEHLEPDYCNRIGQLLVQLLALGVREGRVDARGGFVADLHRVALERSLSVERLFTFVYLLERTVLDELALSDKIGATTEPWPLAAQLVRRASFDLLAGYTARAQLDPSDAAITDRLTTLYTRPLFDAVLAKELERAGRFGYPVSLILFDVDWLSTINKQHGYGVGDKVLERLGILIRQYFRQHDWVARYAEDSMAVLLTRTDAEHANDLAERVRATVEERLGFTDHRSDRLVPVTVSAAVMNVTVALGEIIDAERLMADAETAVERAKERGRNRVERVDGYLSAQRTEPHAPATSP